MYLSDVKIKIIKLKLNWKFNNNEKCVILYVCKNE